RTLRHYDDLGLLAPSYVAGNGYRRYGRRELLRLQRILLLRRLRVPLDQVQRMLDGQANERAALAGHREELLAEREELDRIVATVDRTMAALAGNARYGTRSSSTACARRNTDCRSDWPLAMGRRPGNNSLPR